MAYKKSNANGQATMANSEPVVIASDQSAVPVSSSTLGTAANQTTIIGHLDGVEGLLTTIDADTGGILTSVQTLDNAISGSEMQVDVVAALPAGTNNIGDVDVLTVNGVAPAFGTGLRGATVQRVTIATDDSVPVTNAGITTIAGAVSGTEMQVDVLTMPTVTVTATNLDVQSGGADLATSTQAGAIQTAVQLIDDPIQVLGTDTYTEASSKGMTIGAVRRDADTTLVNTTNEFGPLQMDANGRLKVEAFSGETLPVSLSSTTVTGTVAVTQSGTWDEVGINDSGNSITVDYATTGSGTATGALRVELPTNGTGVIATVGAVTAITNALPAGTNAIGKLAANTGVDIGDVDVTSIIPGTGATNLGKAVDSAAGGTDTGVVGLNIVDAALTAITPVDGDYAPTRVDANGALHMNMSYKLDSTNDRIGIEAVATGGSSVYKTLDLDETEEEVKATAGSLYGYYFYNASTSVRYLKFYNATAANVTVGTTTPVMTFPLPPSSAGNLGLDVPVAFGTAITIAATTGLADSDTGAPSANDVIVNVFYK